MKKLITTVVLVLSLSACGTTAWLTPSTSVTVFHQAERACKDYKGLDSVNVSSGGYNAFCNDGSKQDI